MTIERLNNGIEPKDKLDQNKMDRALAIIRHAKDQHVHFSTDYKNYNVERSKQPKSQEKTTSKSETREQRMIREMLERMHKNTGREIDGRLIFLVTLPFHITHKEYGSLAAIISREFGLNLIGIFSSSEEITKLKISIKTHEEKKAAKKIKNNRDIEQAIKKREATK